MITKLLIAIEDNGIGLTREQIDSFNEAGFDENSKTTLGTNREKGTGIGLMLCRTFTQLMNGSLHVQSEQNIGTTFYTSAPKTTHVLTLSTNNEVCYRLG